MHTNTFTYLTKNLSHTLHGRKFIVDPFKLQQGAIEKNSKIRRNLVNLNMYPHKQTTLQSKHPKP